MTVNISTETIHWTHNLSPFLFQFPEGLPLIGGNGVRYYGLSYILGFIVAYALLLLYFKKKQSPYTPEQTSDFITYNILGVMIGGRLGYMLFYDLPGFLQNPISFFQFWDGGMASHGGFIGVTITSLIYLKVHKQSFLHTADIVSSISAPGLFFGRIANFINGELWGHPSDAPWAIIFPLADNQPRHPSQIYEAFGEGLFLFIYMQLRFWGKLGKRPATGQLAGEFLIGYSLARIICELFREPDASLILGLSRGQFYTIGMILAGILFIYTARIHSKRNPQKA